MAELMSIPLCGKYSFSIQLKRRARSAPGNKGVSGDQEVLDGTRGGGEMRKKNSEFSAKKYNYYTYY
jgi:hypothetical protein